MAMQQTNSSFAKKLGARVAQANAEHKDKPIDTGMRRLPAGIKTGIAKLQFAYTKEQDKDDGKVPKGENFFRTSASVLGQVVNGVLVKDYNGENIEGLTLAKIIPLCDIPANPKYVNSKAVSFSENWYEFQNWFKVVSNGTIVCQETTVTDPTGQKTEAFYFAAMAALTNPKHPVYVEFSTRGWKSPKRLDETDKQYADREEMVFETWHGLTQLPQGAQHDPAAGINAAPTQTTVTNAPHPMDPPPPQTQTQASPARAAAPPPTGGPPPQHQPDSDGNEDFGEEEVAGLVEIALEDPQGKTPDGASATQQLEEAAWRRGWTKEDTGVRAKTWAEVGDMALRDPPSRTAATAKPTAAPTYSAQSSTNGYVVGSRWMYAKRTKDGGRIKNSNGEPFAPKECEIVSVNEATKTVTLKTADGKDVTDIRTKKPAEVKFEWLEQAPPY